MNVTIVTGFAHKLFNARPELIESILERGHTLSVVGIEPEELVPKFFNGTLINYERIDVPRQSMNFVKEFFSIFSVRRALLKLNSDIVLVYGVRFAPVVTIAASFFLKKPVHCVINGAGNLLLLEGVKKFVARISVFPILSFCLRYANSICFQNPDDLDVFVKRKIVKRELSYLTNGSGINLDKIEFSPLKVRDSFLFMSRIIETKGIREFINAAKICKKKYPKAKFVVAGPFDDENDTSLRELVLKSHEEGFISYVGEVKLVKELIANSSVFVFPSYYREGVPRVVIESLAVGRPIITTVMPGCKETVLEGINGFLLKPRDTKELSEKVLFFLENPEKLDAMGAASRNLAEEKFCVNDVNNAILGKLLGVD